MAGTIDPYLTPEDVRLISEGATERFIDAECHSPDSVLLVRGSLFYVQSATAIGMRDLLPRYGELGYGSESEASDALHRKFPLMGPDATVFVHRVIRCGCTNCANLDVCGRNAPRGICGAWGRR